MAKFKYQDGHVFESGVILKKRLYKEGIHWWGEMICPYCKKTFVAELGNVSSGKIRSCGCATNELLSKSKRRKNWIGEKFGKLTVTEYIGGKRRLLKCKCECGNKEYYMDRHHWGRNISCGCQKKSYYEELILKILIEKYNLKVETEKRFDNCFNPDTNMPLRFDFFLPDYNCCIEYDGEQHFKENNWGRDTLADIQYRDNLKNNFCKKENITLIRIPYTDCKKINEDYIKRILNDYSIFI